MAQKRLRVMVVDDHPAVAERIAGLLAEDPAIEVTDRCESGLLAFARISVVRPDAVLMDLEMPGIGGMAAIRRIKELTAPPMVVVVSLHDDADTRSQARMAGADAFVSKGDVVDQLLPALAALFPGHGIAPGSSTA